MFEAWDNAIAFTSVVCVCVCVCVLCVCVCIQLSSREREVGELREEVREGEEKREEGERQRDDIITNLQEKVCTTHAYTFYTHTCTHTHTQISSLENELQIQSNALEVCGRDIHALYTYFCLVYTLVRIKMWSEVFVISVVCVVI